MSYLVLARKYRPKSFTEVVGQQHVLQALSNALQQGRLHHAYLFSGTRGVGKTSLARLLAKCLNCEQEITATPCDKCDNCLAIAAGNFVDLLEIDAASRTKVEDTRELLENVQYAPTRGRYKIYLIDEVHMLSGHSFNALLKTLEEPPPHVKFLLATTEPQKLPVTVLSRCLQFHLKNITAEKISAHLAQILKAEQINFETAALNVIAQAANGSMRDALSLLDQAVAYGGGQIVRAQVDTMLGNIEQGLVLELLKALINETAATVFTVLEQLSEITGDFSRLLEMILSYFHRIALFQLLPERDSQDDIDDLLKQLATQLTPEATQLYYQIGLIGRRDLPLAPSPRSGFEMILLRMLAFRPEESGTVTTTTPTTTKTMEPKTTEPKTTQSQATKAIPIAAADLAWTEIVNQLNLQGFTLMLAKQCSIKEQSADALHLVLDSNQTALLNPTQEARLAQALTQFYGKPIRLKITTGTSETLTPAKIEHQRHQQQLQTTEQSLIQDANIQNLMQTFGAKMQPETIQIAPTQASSEQEN